MGPDNSPPQIVPLNSNNKKGPDTDIVACSIDRSRLDYCNALLCAAPEATFNELQRVHNNLARVVCQRGRRWTTA